MLLPGPIQDGLWRCQSSQQLVIETLKFTIPSGSVWVGKSEGKQIVEEAEEELSKW